MKCFIFYLIVAIVCSGMHSCTNTSLDAERNVEQKQVNETTIVAHPVFYASHEPKKENAPFSDVVQVGNTFYLSGQIGIDHSVRELVAGGIEAETRQTIENIKEVLAEHEMTLRDVVKCLVVLDDINDFSAFNTIYETYFPQKPARTTFAAEALALGATIEIEVIAVRTPPEK